MAGHPRRVALVIGQLSRGGAEGQIAQLTRELDRSRFELLVYCLSAQTEPVGSDIAANGTVIRVLTGGRLSRVRQLLHALDADRIDLVHAWLYLANAAAATAHLLRPSRPLITSARNCKVQGPFNHMANAVAFRSSQAIVANSQGVATYITHQYWAPRDRIRVIYNGIDVDRFRPDEHSGGTLGPIVTVGRLVKQKNHDMFLRAAARLAQEVNEVRFFIVGSGPLRHALEEQARALRIADRVAFAGERDDVELILRGASLFWMTSRWEGMPNVVLEAMASGVPVIGTDAGGTRELIRSGVDGFITALGDAEAFVRHSLELLRDAAMRQRFATAARQRAEEFSTARMVDGISRLYDQVLG